MIMALAILFAPIVVPMEQFPIGGLRSTGFLPLSMAQGLRDALSNGLVDSVATSRMVPDNLDCGLVDLLCPRATEPVRSTAMCKPGAGFEPATFEVMSPNRGSPDLENLSKSRARASNSRRAA